MSGAQHRHTHGHAQTNLRTRAMRALAPLAAVVAAIAAWALFKQMFGVKDFVLPSPLGVLHAFTEDPAPFLRGTLETATSAGIGFAIAAIGGVLVGSALSLWPPCTRVTGQVLWACALNTGASRSFSSAATSAGFASKARAAAPVSAPTRPEAASRYWRVVSLKRTGNW